MRRRLVVLWVLVALVLAAFGAELMQGALRSPAILLSLGGNAPVLVADGQWWRLVTANFLHASWIHLGLNCVALAVLGGVLERLVGALRMLVVSLVSGLVGNVASTLVSSYVFAVGISGMVFGMMGALLVVNLRSRDALPGGFHVGWRGWIVLLGLNGLISLLPGVAGVAHLGGLLGGAVAAMMLVPKDLDRSRSRLAAGVVGGLLAIVYAAAFGVALNAPREDAQAEYLHAALDNPRLASAALNAAAWKFATDPATDRETLARIERATTQLVKDNPHKASYRDTHAYALYRAGQLEQAIEQERIALIDVENARSAENLYTMFFRFLAERGKSETDATVRREGGDIIIESAIPGAVIFAGDPRQGWFVRIVLPEGTREARVAAPQGIEQGDLPVWLVDGSGPEPRTPTAQINFARRDVATAWLP